MLRCLTQDSRTLTWCRRLASSSQTKIPARSTHAPPRRRNRPVQVSRSSPAPVVYTHTNLKVAIVGRPNVGKSTLFNRLGSAVRGRGNDGFSNPSPLVFVRSVVDSVPGVTRDPREASAALSDLMLTVVDTPGLENAVGEDGQVSSLPDKRMSTSLASATALCNDRLYRDMYKKMEASTVSSVDQADLVFFVVDAAEGITTIDHAIAKWLRTVVSKSARQVMLVANKCDVADSEKRVTDAYELGFGHPIVLSAEQGLGFADLYAEIDRVHQDYRKNRTELKVLGDMWTKAGSPEPYDAEREDLRSSFDDELVIGCGERANEEPLRQLIVAILGRPNVGKSTLTNCLAGEERSIVGPTAGVTRDAVLCEWKTPQSKSRDDDIPVWLVDTAGVRAQMKLIDEPLEQLSVKSTLRALRHCHVVLVLMDSREPLCQQDTKLLDLVVTHGRAAVLVINKMDKLDEPDLQEWRLALRYKVDSKAFDLAGVEVVEICAKNWEADRSQARKLFAAVQRARERWERRVPTAALNRFVTKFNDRLSVGAGTQGQKRNRTGVTKFITQKKIRPPMFRLDGSSAVSMSYLRALTNAIRLEFGFEGVPIRVKRPSRRGRK